MQIDLINEETGEVWETLELPDETWVQIEVIAQAEGKEPEEVFKDLLENYVKRFEETVKEAEDGDINGGNGTEPEGQQPGAEVQEAEEGDQDG